jgi:hypothetical protein
VSLEVVQVDATVRPKSGFGLARIIRQNLLFTVGHSIRGVKLRNYDHIISSEERNGVLYLKIERIFDGRRDLCTEIPVSKPGAGQDVWDNFEEISAALGKALCIDIAPLRSFLGID